MTRISASEYVNAAGGAKPNKYGAKRTVVVAQDKLYVHDGIGNGNCFPACLASILEIPLWMIPPFDQMFGRAKWGDRRQEWLERIGALGARSWTAIRSCSPAGHMIKGR